MRSTERVTQPKFGRRPMPDAEPPYDSEFLAICQKRVPPEWRKQWTHLVETRRADVVLVRGPGGTIDVLVAGTTFGLHRAASVREATEFARRLSLFVAGRDLR